MRYQKSVRPVSKMLAAAFLAFFFASTSAEHFAPVADDDPSVQVVKNVITRANYYLEDHLLTELSLPNIGGMLPTDAVTLTDGKIGEFDTLVLQGAPDIQKRTKPDGSTTYLFYVKMAMQQLAIKYQFKVKVLGFVLGNGTVQLVPEENTLGAKGIVVVRKDGQCEASFYGMSIDKLDGIKVVIQPDDIPGLTTISETILNFVTPKVVPVTNLALNGAALSPSFQSSFSHFVCKEFNHSIDFPPSTEATEQPTEEPTEVPTNVPSIYPAYPPKHMV